jgi:hypothetical protein
MGMWIEFGLFCLVLLFALHQFHDLKKERQKRDRQRDLDSGQNRSSTDK